MAADAATPRVGQHTALGNDLIASLDTLGIQRATLAGFDWSAVPPVWPLRCTPNA